MSVHSIVLAITNYRQKITCPMISVNTFLKKKLQKHKMRLCS